MAVGANGAALIASDSQIRLHESDKNPWNDPPVARFNGDIVSATTWPTRTVRWWTARMSSRCRRTNCPTRPREPGRVWGVFRGLTRLATNQPTYIEEPINGTAGEYQYPLARLPKSSTVWGQQFNPPPLFAVGGDGQPRWVGERGYAFLAVADSSVYINQMLMEPGTDNLEFTLRTIEDLQGPGKHRKRCLFFENGKVVERFDGLREALAKPRPKIPPEAMPNIGPQIGKNQEKLTDWANALADQHPERSDLPPAECRGAGRSGSGRRRSAKWVGGGGDVLAAIAIVVLPAPPHLEGPAAAGRAAGADDRRGGRVHRPAGRVRPPAEGTGTAEQPVRTGAHRHARVLRFGRRPARPGSADPAPGNLRRGA